MKELRTLAALAAATAAVGLGTSPADAMGRGNGNRAEVGRARTVMVRPADGVDDDAKGRIDVATRPGNKSELRIKGQRLDPAASVDVTIEGDAGEVVLADGATVDDEGCVHLKIRDWKGDVLPLGATSLDELVGRTIRIRTDGVDATGDPILQGVVGDMHSNLPRRVRGRSTLTNVDEVLDPDAKGKVRVQFRRKDMRSRLDIKVANLTVDAAVSFLIDDGTGTLVEVGTATVDADGEARYRVRTDHGDLLPFGAATILDLAGREIRVDVDGAPQLSGNVPN